jgi:hypothetical protein
LSFFRPLAAGTLRWSTHRAVWLERAPLTPAIDLHSLP